MRLGENYPTAQTSEVPQTFLSSLIIRLEQENKRQYDIERRLFALGNKLSNDEGMIVKQDPSNTPTALNPIPDGYFSKVSNMIDYYSSVNDMLYRNIDKLETLI